MSDKMIVEVWSDIACPYCYIGKKKFEAALAQFPHRDKIKLVWYSYELNPALPKSAGNQSFYEYFAEAHGYSVEEAKSDAAKVAQLAADAGLKFNFDKLVVTNTSDALRLIKLAQVHSKENEVGTALFKAYFTDGECVSDRKVLVRIGTEAGIKEDEIVKMLDSKKYLSEIEKDMDYSENGLNLEYIPFYLFNNKYVTQGAVEPEEYLRILTESFAEWEKSGVAKGEKDVTKGGKSCSSDGVCSL
ncbi:DsbA family oxidoreductase [Dysgonomonas sp. 25]|uniref:DsbA family oxidoreductase n=1 Tax=Dysgonomonas sp. 25 TaxID=2302933 RepID=UPI0013D1FC8B|nr:DsbA family oxidoreductase [Dysgonomonas sp. 25]NDV68348.1 DsbA family oxidoreductase [Dysgonomonas sp. 25]